jgi:hypothetical protein
MNTIFDKPAIGVAAVILGSIALFVPTVIAHLRRIRAFRSVSALNALTLLPAVCFLVAGWFCWGLSPLHYWKVSPLLFWSAVAIWAAATIWSLMGKQRDS